MISAQRRSSRGQRWRCCCLHKEKRDCCLPAFTRDRRVTTVSACLPFPKRDVARRRCLLAAAQKVSLNKLAGFMIRRIATAKVDTNHEDSKNTKEDFDRI